MEHLKSSDMMGIAITIIKGRELNNCPIYE